MSVSQMECNKDKKEEEQLPVFSHTVNASLPNQYVAEVDLVEKNSRMNDDNENLQLLLLLFYIPTGTSPKFSQNVRPTNDSSSLFRDQNVSRGYIHS